MSDHDMQHVIDGVVNATVKHNNKWNLAKLGAFCLFLIAIGAWKEDWRIWRGDISARVSKVESRVDDNSGFIKTMQGEHNERMRIKNDAAGMKLTKQP
jgi:hypothetical protein